MQSITRGRSLATTVPPGRVGDESFPSAAQQLPGLIPGTVAAYPGCTPRPRNLPEYQAACLVAAGEPVVEYNACQVVEGMRVYWPWRRRFLEAIGADRMGPGPDVELRLAETGLYVINIIPATTPVYVLAPTSDASHAPDTGALLPEPTGAVR